MYRFAVVGIVFAVTLAGAMILAPARTASADGSLVVEAAPSTILLGGPQPTHLTVHAEIPYSIVVDVALTINGVDIPVVYTKPDLRGELVAKFMMSDVRAAVEPGTALLSLAVLADDAITYEGDCTVRVVDYAGGGCAR